MDSESIPTENQPDLGDVGGEDTQGSEYFDQANDRRSPGEVGACCLDQWHYVLQFTVVAATARRVTRPIMVSPVASDKAHLVDARWARHRLAAEGVRYTEAFTNSQVEPGPAT